MTIPTGSSRRRFLGGSAAAIGAGLAPWSAARAAGDGADGEGADGGRIPERLTEAITPPATVAGAVVGTLAIGDAVAMGTTTNPAPSPGLIFQSGGRMFNGSSGNSWVHFRVPLPDGATLAKVHVLGELGAALTLTVQTVVFDMFAQTQVLDSFQQTVAGPYALDATPAAPFVAETGRTLSVLALARQAGQGIYGVIYQYLPAAGDVFVPVSPFRAFDSRLGVYANSGLLAPNTSKVIGIRDAHDTNGVVTTAGVVPASATAVTYNLTVTGQTGPNFVAVTPGDATAYTASAINFAGPGSLANAATVEIDGSGRVKLWGGDQTGSTHTIIDITGYYAPPGSSAT